MRSTLEAASIVRDLHRDGLVAVCRGSGTKQDWGNAPRGNDVWLDTGSLAGVVEHAAGDLVAVVRAGTLVAELQEVLAKAGQQLAIDPGLADATVGGTVAANVSGPRRMAYGTVRDLLIGITVVRPDGVIARSGGKVVKNVAGYDLAKLFTGSYGTLGLITECAFRLHPIQMGTASVSAAFADPQEAAPRIAAVLRSQLAPTELEVTAAPGEPVTVMARFDGHAAELRAAGAGALLGGQACDSFPDWAFPWQPGDIGMKVSVPLSKVASLLSSPVRIRGSAGVGVLYAACSVEQVSEVRAAATEAGGHAVVVTAPDSVRDKLDMWGPVPGLELMRRIKQQFDPDGRFAPGRFVGGI